MKQRTRDLLEEIRPFFEDERAKFIVGPRYSGKTAFLSQIAHSLEGKKVHASHIIRIDFGDDEFSKIRTYRSFIDYLKKKIVDGRKYYLLLDRVRECQDLGIILRALNRSFYCSVFAASDDGPYLQEALRSLSPSDYLKFFLGPISFPEYLDEFPKTKNREELLGLFQDYALADTAYFFEGEEVIADRGFLRKILFEEIYKKHPNLPFSTFFEACQEIVSSAGADFHPSLVQKKLARKGIRLECSTLIRYAQYLEETSLIARLDAYSEDGKEYLRGNKRYFPLFHQLLNYPVEESWAILAKTLVYLSLRAHGYELRYGKTYAGRFDFVVQKEGKMCLVQVTDYLEGNEGEKERIYSSFRPMKTSCPRFVVSLDETDCSYRGIRNLNLVDFLLGKAPLYLA